MTNAASSVLPGLPAVPGVDHAFIELSDGRMHVAEAGSGEAVILLAGFGQSWWQWRDLMPALAGRFRVLAPDLRGEGWSMLPPEALTRTRRMTDVIELLDALGLDRVRLVSHDIGAVTGYQLALTHPERVVSQVMLAVPPPQMRFAPELLPGMRYLWFEEALAVPGLGPALLRGRRLPEWLFSRFSAEPLPRHVVDLYVSLLREPFRARAASFACRRMVLPELLRIVGGRYREERFRMPTLVVFGTEDISFPPRVLDRVFSDPDAFGPEVRLAYVDGSSHYVTDERPAETGRLIRDFFDRFPEGKEQE